MRGILFNAIISFVGYTLVFALLTKVWPNDKKQPLFARQGLLTDVYYYFGTVFIYSLLAALLIETSRRWLGKLTGQAPDNAVMFAWLATWPMWLQVGVMWLLSDFLQYWLHRWFHGPTMWRYHAIHHSATQLDWLTSFRFHPVNYILYATSVTVLFSLIGFAPAAAILKGPLDTAQSLLSHANLNWTFGPLRWLVAIPVFHRWHHTKTDVAQNKNFAATFPFFDLLFGTYYMPEGVQPADYGVDEPVPEDLGGQLLYPFQAHEDSLPVTAQLHS